VNRIEVCVSRTIAASPGEVFDVWLDPKSPGSPWFGPERVIINATVDGLFYHCVRHEGRLWAHYGRFVRLDRPRVIEHTWVSEATRGIESTVTVTLEAIEGSTLLTLRHRDLPADDMGRRHEEGWTFVVQAIGQRFASSLRR
jgi:uncharacterized protein YndB with AHSA1/START domain